MKAVIFSRVSSKDQETGHSIDAQTVKLKAYCERLGYDIAKTYQVTESSTVGERKQFKHMLEYVGAASKKSGKRVVLTIDKIDRLMRNFNHYPEISRLIENDMMEIHIVGDNSIISKESGSMEKAMFNMGIVFAQVNIDVMKEHVKRSIDHKIKKGEIITKAPLGYKNYKNEHGKSDVKIDEECCFFIKKIFQEYSTGTYSLGDITKMAEGWGLRNKTVQKGKISKSQIHNIVNNKFYIGISKPRGIEVTHPYPRLIDEVIFHKCQAVLAKANKMPFKYAAKPFLFRGMVSCAKCGCSFSSYEKKGHVYLRPTKSKGECDCKPIKEEQALQTIKGIFKALYIPPALLEEMKAGIKQICEGHADYQLSEFEALTKEYKDIERQKSRLLDLLLRDEVQSITQDIYDKKMQELQQRQHEISNKIDGHVEDDKVFQITLKSLLALCSNSYEVFESSQIEQKRKLMSFVLANLQIKDGILCYSLRKPFDELLNIAKNKEWRE
ncbi:MAG: recombinase family protein [Rickettsiales bacterium]|nr:recombinase family protein [Pseudomonadota bacterium]MDA0966085.1 recombinase family protein [Pseudomonadota bacterium]MDG4544268.1 recombinase family protein [Rickettsiales bacterium]MDG4546447.1 recombinase family protein [Rickettsiales bacterium]MDG4548593.1 recombinase family protein [Rickettsiales bacterium]